MNIEPKILRIIRYVAWAVIAVVLVLVFGSQLGDPKTARVSEPQALDIGGTFQMVNQFGEPMTEKDFLGKPTMMFFGFTSCPAICPGALADMELWLEKLGKDADSIHAVFASVDPERDTVARISEYLKNYDQRIIGLTGTPEQVAAMAKAYKIYYKKMPVEGGDYMVDHSATIYLFNKDGNLTSTIDQSENRDIALAKVRKLVLGNK